MGFLFASRIYCLKINVVLFSFTIQKGGLCIAVKIAAAVISESLEKSD